MACGIAGIVGQSRQEFQTHDNSQAKIRQAKIRQAAIYQADNRQARFRQAATAATAEAIHVSRSDAAGACGACRQRSDRGACAGAAAMGQGRQGRPWARRHQGNRQPVGRPAAGRAPLPKDDPSERIDRIERVIVNPPARPDDPVRARQEENLHDHASLRPGVGPDAFGEREASGQSASPDTRISPRPSNRRASGAGPG